MPDFRGRLEKALDIFADGLPDVMNHNLETVPRLYKEARPGSDYMHSLKLLKDFKARYNSYQGTALGLAHTLRQTAIFRPKNISKKVADLYYVGAGTNPGIGMPITLISAELLYKRIIGDKTSGPLKKI